MKTANSANSVINRVLAQRPVKAKSKPATAATAATAAAIEVAAQKPEQEAGLNIPNVSEVKVMIKALKAPALPALPDAPIQTLMAVILDESGSMSHGCKQTMKGYNDQMKALRKTSAKIGCRVMQTTFQSSARIIADDVSPDDIVPLSEETYNPGGGTALYDTVAAVVKRLLAHPLAQQDNTSILLMITTDGDDTSSRKWKTSSQLTEFRALMKAVSKNDRWTVALAGPDLMLRQFSDEMSADPENVAAFAPTDLGSRADAMNSSVHAMNHYTTMRSMGTKKASMMHAGTLAGARAKAILKKAP